MGHNIHPQAKTTPLVRAEIQSSPGTQRQIGEQYSISIDTVRKWQRREDTLDRSHRPHKLQTTLSPEQEVVVVELRKTLLLPLDDLLVITREFIHPEASRSALDRCLRRHNVPSLRAMQAELKRQAKADTLKKTFKDYEPGFVHIDVKYLPQMPDERQRRYLFVAIDRATRWVHLEIRADKSALSAQRFLKQVIAKAPFKIRTLLSDNGKEFTDRFVANGERDPTGHHLFDQLCMQQGIEHRLIKPAHPQTNGMVERFNGRIADILATTHFDSSLSLKQTLTRYLHLYNYYVPQKALGHITPVQALKNWYADKPKLFKKRVVDHPGPDNFTPY